MQNTKGDETMTDVTTIGSLLLQKLMNALHQSLKVDSLHYIGTPRYRDTHEWFCDGVKFYTSWKATGIDTTLDLQGANFGVTFIKGMLACDYDCFSCGFRCQVSIPVRNELTVYFNGHRVPDHLITINMFNKIIDLSEPLIGEIGKEMLNKGIRLDKSLSG